MADPIQLPSRPERDHARKRDAWWWADRSMVLALSLAGMAFIVAAVAGRVM
jgi:hypothetical protein